MVAVKVVRAQVPLIERQSGQRAFTNTADLGFVWYISSQELLMPRSHRVTEHPHIAFHPSVRDTDQDGAKKGAVVITRIRMDIRENTIANHVVFFVGIVVLIRCEKVDDTQEPLTDLLGQDKPFAHGHHQPHDNWELLMRNNILKHQDGDPTQECARIQIQEMLGGLES